MKKQKKPKTIRNIIGNHIKNNLKDYTILLLLFIIGLIIGVIFINYTKEEQKQEIASYIMSFVNEMKENGVIDKGKLLQDTILKNTFLALVIWFVGIAVTLWPVIYGIVIFRGFSLGYTVSSIIGTLGIGKGLTFSIFAIFLQNILIIPATLGLAMSGIRLYKSVIKNNESVKIEILRSYNIFSINACTSYIISICRNFYINKFVKCSYTIHLKNATKKIKKIIKNLFTTLF